MEDQERIELKEHMFINSRTIVHCQNIVSCILFPNIGWLATKKELHMGPQKIKAYMFENPFSHFLLFF